MTKLIEKPKTAGEWIGAIVVVGCGVFILAGGALILAAGIALVRWLWGLG